MVNKRSTLLELVILAVYTVSSVAASHCRPRQPANGALAPGAGNLVSSTGSPSLSGAAQAQITVTRTITVTSSPSGSGSAGNKGTPSSAAGAMVTAYFNSKDKYPSVGPIVGSSSSLVSGPNDGQATPPKDAGTTGSMSILPITSSGWNSPSGSVTTPKLGGWNGDSSPEPSPTLPPYISAPPQGASLDGHGSQGSWSASGDGSSGRGPGGKVTDRLPGGQGGAVVTNTTPASGAWGPNPTLSTSTPGANPTYNR